MSTLKAYRASLDELAATTPKKKAALIRSLLPGIEAALSSGQTMKEVWSTLDHQGLRMGYHAFQVTVWRARKRRSTTAPAGENNAVASDRQRVEGLEPQKLEPRDPLANLKRLEENRPGFQWRATPRMTVSSRATEDGNGKVQH